MNRIKRDYCRKSYHPNWREWEATYDKNNFGAMWPFMHCECIYCGQFVEKTCTSNPVWRIKLP